MTPYVGLRMLSSAWSGYVISISPCLKFEGQVMGTYLFLYGVARYFLEFISDDPDRGSVFGGAMTGTQLISICLVIIGGILWLRRVRLQQPATVARAAR